jgi:DNA modification methylase
MGLESTPEEYVAKMVEVFREVKRVLRDDGTLWLNLGDSYASKAQTDNFSDPKAPRRAPGDRCRTDCIKPKNLVGIPWRIAFALQADGWYLRSDIIWSKPNPMPESVTDRPTKAHEYIFLLSKSERYYYDAEAIKEEVKWERWGKQTCIKDYRGIKPVDIKSLEDRREQGKNKRTVWNISTKPFSEAHFATFPPEIPETCIKAGTSEKGCCPKCGSPWKRITELTGHINKREPAHAPNNCPTKTDSTGWAPTTRTTDKWQPTCSCDIDETIPCTVLEPFAGSGTTLWVAEQLGVDSIGIELSLNYCEDIIRPRMASIEPSLFKEG